MSIEVPITTIAPPSSAEVNLSQALVQAAEQHAGNLVQEASSLASREYGLLTSHREDSDVVYTPEERMQLNELGTTYGEKVFSAAFDMAGTMYDRERKVARAESKLQNVQAQLSRADRLGIDGQDASVTILKQKEAKLLRRIEKAEQKEAKKLAHIQAELKDTAYNEALDINPYEFWGVTESTDGMIGTANRPEPIEPISPVVPDEPSPDQNPSPSTGGSVNSELLDEIRGMRRDAEDRDARDRAEQAAAQDERARQIAEYREVAQRDITTPERRLYSGTSYQVSMEFMQYGEVRHLSLDIFVDGVHGLMKNSEATTQTSYSCTVKGKGKFEDFKVILPAAGFSDIESHQRAGDDGRSKRTDFTAVFDGADLIVPGTRSYPESSRLGGDGAPERTRRLLLSSLAIREDMILRVRQQVQSGLIPLDTEGRPDIDQVDRFITEEYSEELAKLSQIIEDQSAEDLGGSAAKKARRSIRLWRAGIPRYPEEQVLDVQNEDRKRTLGDWWQNPNSSRTREVLNGSDRLLENQSPWRYQQRKARSILDLDSIISEQ